MKVLGWEEIHVVCWMVVFLKVVDIHRHRLKAELLGIRPNVDPLIWDYCT